MAGLDWEPLVNRRRAFRMFLFYKMHSGLVAIHPTLYLTPRQYHTSHKYYILHSRIDQHAFYSSLVLLDCGTNYQPLQHMQHRSTSLRPGWHYCKAFVIVNQIIFNSTTHTCTHTHFKKTTLLFYILSDFTTNSTLSMHSPYAKIISLLMLGII